MKTASSALTTTLRLFGTAAMLFISRAAAAQGVTLPTIDPAVIARLNDLAQPNYQAAWRDTTPRPAYHRQRIAVVISSRDCIGGRDPRFVPATRAALRLLSEQSRRDSSSFSAIGVALDWEVDSGAVFLGKLADFDQWMIGGNWGNDEMVRLVWRDAKGVASIPQLVVVERRIGMRNRTAGRRGTVYYFDHERVVKRLVSAGAISRWVLATVDSAQGTKSIAYTR